MPFFIKSQRLLTSFPSICPFCGVSETDTRFPQIFSKMRLGMIPGSVVSETIKPLLPGCENCANWFRTTRILLFLFGFAALSGHLGVLAAILVWNASTFVINIWLITIPIWMALFILRKWKGDAFKIVYFSDKEVVYAGREKKYMNELAALNGLNCEQKLFIIRWS